MGRHNNNKSDNASLNKNHLMYQCKSNLELTPQDTVADVKRMLHGNRETCHYTCYELKLHSPDGSIYPLKNDILKLSEICDRDSYEDCSLEIVPVPYNATSILAHVVRTRELLSASTTDLLYSSLLKEEIDTDKGFEAWFSRPLSVLNSYHSKEVMLPSKWIALHPLPDHTRDAERAENERILSFGWPLFGSERDWNHELQSSRDLPFTSKNERMLRDRALYEVSSDFVDAAKSGAIGVISGCIPPIYPEFPSMFVHNNILFKFDVDPGSKGDEFSGSHRVAAYANSNNVLKATKAYQEADVPGLYTLAMAIVDYRGHRVVAESILPDIVHDGGFFERIYWSDGNGERICWDGVFHSKVLEASKCLRMKEHTLHDGSGSVFKIAAPLGCNGVVGHDGRYYVLSMKRATPRDANYTGPGSKCCILRPELITAFCRDKAVDEDIRFNLNVFTECNMAPEEVSADEGSVREVSTYLKSTVIPKFIRDVCKLEVSPLDEISPMDGQTLTEALHSRGINVRYIGDVAKGVEQLPHLKHLCISEIIIRSAKHIMKDKLREAADEEIADTIAHFYNCLFGNCHQRDSPNRWPKDELEEDKEASFTLSSNILWDDISKFADDKYQFKFPGDARSLVKHMSVVRNLCLKVGVTIICKEYDLSAEKPFESSDIVDLQPVVKHSIPVCQTAKDLVEEGRVLLANLESGNVPQEQFEADLVAACTMFQDADRILHKVGSGVHPQQATCSMYAARALYLMEQPQSAVDAQILALVLNERRLGFDHPVTAKSYWNMALIVQEREDLPDALMLHALLLLKLSSGPYNPYLFAACKDMALIAISRGDKGQVLNFLLHSALAWSKRDFGADSIQVALSLHASSVTHHLRKSDNLALMLGQRAHTIFEKEHGKDNPITLDSEKWITHLKAAASKDASDDRIAFGGWSFVQDGAGEGSARGWVEKRKKDPNHAQN